MSEEINYIALSESSIASSSHLKISKQAIKIIGLIPAILLSDLLSKSKYFREKGNLDDSGFFFSEQSYIKEDLGLSEYYQKNALKQLVDGGFIESKRVGIPPRIWYKINYHTVFTNILNISDIKTKNFIYNNKNKYNKVTKVTKRVSPSVNSDLLFLLEEWRLKETTPTNQHHLKNNTKVQAKIAMLTNLLLKGKFGSHCTIKDDFLKLNNIPKKALSNKYTEEELLAGLDEMALMFQYGNQPEDKSKIEKMSFDQLIYHPIAKMSYLLKYLYNDAQPLSYKTVEVYDHWLEKLYEERIFDRSIEDDNHQFGILKKGLAGIEEYYNWFLNNQPEAISFSLISSEDKFFNTYVKWISGRPIHADRPYNIGPQNNKWYQFIKWLEEAIHGDYVNQNPSLDRRKYK